MTLLIKNIKGLVQVRDTNVSVVKGKDMKNLPVLDNSYLLIDHDTIVDYGLMGDIGSFRADEEIDATGKYVLPTWCDSHTHLVFAGDRSSEFVDRINGLTYQEIAEKGGGILNSAKTLSNTSEDELYRDAHSRLTRLILQGTGAIEIKSGYGLTLDTELKILRVIKRLKRDFPVKVKSTFLAAHAVPLEYKNRKKDYVDLIVDTMIPAVGKEKLADYIDVFCEEGYFDLEDTDRILSSAKAYGMRPKIHVNQFNAMGGVPLGVKHNALSVDHLEELNEEDIEALKGSDTMATALPACSYFIGIPYTPARRLIDAGLPLALASDFNPGSSPTGNMNFVVSSACIKMNMTPEEAINAATINSAYAMDASNQYGSITKGKKANLIITKTIPSYHYMMYAFADHHIDQVLINGEVFK